jgi:hypothetical protein
MSFLGSTTARGNMKAFCIGGVLYNEDTRVETANVNGFFINRLKWTAESL